jgi:hypothetical protein
MLVLVDRMGEVTSGHGFRSTFRGWAAGARTSRGEVVGAAYCRDDLFQKRRQLMEGWVRLLRVEAPSREGRPD